MKLLWYKRNPEDDGYHMVMVKFDNDIIPTLGQLGEVHDLIITGAPMTLDVRLTPHPGEPQFP